MRTDETRLARFSKSNLLSLTNVYEGNQSIIELDRHDGNLALIQTGELDRQFY